MLTLQLATESGNNSVTVCGASDGSDGNTGTLLKLHHNSVNAADIIMLPKHNIADTVGKAYCITLRVNKNDNRVSLLTNGQLLGYHTYTALALSKLGLSCLKATVTAPTSGGVNVGIGQIKTRLYY